MPFKPDGLVVDSAMLCQPVARFVHSCLDPRVSGETRAKLIQANLLDRIQMRFQEKTVE